MKFKKFLAVVLAAAVSFSSVNLSGISSPVTVMAAVDNTHYTAKITSGNNVVTTSTPIEVAYGDSVTISAESVRNTGVTTDTGDTIYSWSYTADDGKVKTEYDKSLTLTPKKNVNGTYAISLKISQNYTLDGGKAIDEIFDGTLTVKVVQKTVQKADIVEPTFNKVYMSYTASADATTNKKYVELSSVKENLINSTDTHGGQWTVNSPDNTKLYLGENELEFVYTLPKTANYKGFVSTKDADKDTTWTENTDSYSFTIKKKVTLLDAADYVTSIDDAKTGKGGTNITEANTVLYYSSALASDNKYGLNTTKVYVNYAGTYDETKAKATTATLKFTSDDSNVDVSDYNDNTKELTIKVNGTSSKTNGVVTITASDAAGTGIKNQFKIKVMKGLRTDDIAFATIPTKYTWVKEATVKNIFDITAENARTNNATAPTHISYTIDGTAGSSATLIKANTDYVFVGTYTLQNGEAHVELNGDKTAYVKTDAAVSKTVTTHVDPAEVTEEYILAAINALTVDEVKLNGGTISYGTDLKDVTNSNNYEGINLKIYAISSNGDATSVAGGNVPSVGSHTEDYIIKVTSKDNGTNYHIANSLCKDYPISFTVEKKNLAASIKYSTDGTTYKTADSAVQNETATRLKAEYSAYAGAESDYTFKYQWYRNNTVIEGATSDVYVIDQDKYNGTYYCVVTAEAKGTSGRLSGTVATSATVSLIKTDMVVWKRTTDVNTGEVEIVKQDLGTASYNATMKGTVIVPGSLNFQVQAAKKPNTTDYGYAIGETSVIVKNAKGAVLNTQTFDATSSTYQVVNYTAPDDLDAGTYEIWVKTSNTITKKADNTKTNENYEAKIATYTVAAYSTAFENEDLKEKDGKTAITYGDIPSQKLGYEFSLKKTSGYTAAQVEKINNLVNSNYTFTVTLKTIVDAGDDAGVKVTAAAKQNPSTNILATLGKDLTPAKIKVNAKDLHLDVNVPEGEDGITWILGKNNKIEATYNSDEFVTKNGKKDTAESLGLAYTYSIWDKDNNLVSESGIAAGEYTVKLEEKESVANYNIIAGTAKLTVVAELTGISASDVMVLTEKTATIKVVAIPTEAAFDPTKLKFESKDTEIATVDDKGVVTGVKNGRTEITITLVDAEGNAVEGIEPVTVNVTVSASEKLYTLEELMASANAQAQETASANAAALSAKDEEVQSAKAAATAAETAKNEAENRAAQAEAAVASANAEANAAKAELASADAKIDATKAEVEAAKKDVEKANADKTVAEAALASANAEAAQAKSDADAAKAEADAAKADKAAAEEKATEAAAKLTEAETNASAAQTKLNTSLADLEAAKAAQATAEANLKAAQADLATAQTAQKTAEANLKAAQDAQKAAEAKVKTAEAAQKAAESAQKAAEKKVTAAKAVKKGEIFVSGKNLYKITNVSKKTVEFVGTYSTGKSVTIADTVKYSKNGVTYKVTSIAASAMKGNTTVTKVTIGKNVTTIGKNAFNGCSKLKTVTVKSSKIKTVKSGAFKIAKKATVKVPSAKVSAYKELFKKAGLPSTATVKK